MMSSALVGGRGVGQSQYMGGRLNVSHVTSTKYTHSELDPGSTHFRLHVCPGLGAGT